MLISFANLTLIISENIGSKNNLNLVNQIGEVENSLPIRMKEIKKFGKKLESKIEIKIH